MTLVSCAICDVGLVRTENQDNLFINGAIREPAEDTTVFRHRSVSEFRGLYAVADGMGGGAHGGLASLVTVQKMQNRNFYGDSSSMSQFLLECNEALCDLVATHNGARMGSTFAGLCIDGRVATITNIGDSRIYRLRNNQLLQLSVDHTATRQMVELGLLSEEAARLHPDRHRLTQHLGVLPTEMLIEPYNNQVDLLENDIFLLCSDGLTDMLTDSDILRVLSTYDTVELRADTLFVEALKNGGADNISILVVSVSGSNKMLPPSPPPLSVRKSPDMAMAKLPYKKTTNIPLFAILSVCVVAFVVVLFFALGDSDENLKYAGNDCEYNVTQSGRYEVGDIKRFGEHYWRVLHVGGTRYLLLSENILDTMPFHSEWEEGFTWETSSIRQFLHNGFYNEFDDDCRGRILPRQEKNADGSEDKIFLLSIGELRYLGFVREKCEYECECLQDVFAVSNEYDCKRVAQCSAEYSPNWWWLRCSGEHPRTPAFVDYQGKIILFGANAILPGGVRPAMWVMLNQEPSE